MAVKNIFDSSHLLSVIVPARNEEKSIVETMRRLRDAVPGAEILVIDGGQDRTPQKIEKMNREGASINYFKNIGDRGKGHAIRCGIQLASRQFVAQFDADLQFRAEDLLPMLTLLVEGRADFVCGSRFLRDSIRTRGSVPGARSFGNRAISLYTSLFLGKCFTDVLAGVKMWRRAVTDSFFLSSDKFCYEVELPIKAHRRGFRVLESPVKTDARQHGKSSVNVLKTGLSLLKDIPRFRWGGLK